MRLIDADALMKVIREHDYPLRSHFNSTDNGMFTIGVQQAVDDAPTIDVEPVVRGEWVRKNNELYCSACGEEALMDEVYYESKRCPECGAHMKMSEPKQPDRCTTCENNGKPICSNCIMTGYGNDIDFYHTAGEA